jgi:uncharacterized membrane protein
MKDERRQDRRLWDLLMKFHVVAYAALWIASIYTLATTPWGIMSHSMHIIITVTLFWTVFLLAHVAVHFYTLGRHAIDERQIYREGFSDAIHQFVEHADDAHPHVLDDGEFPELFGHARRYR